MLCFEETIQNITIHENLKMYFAINIIRSTLPYLIILHAHLTIDIINNNRINAKYHQMAFDRIGSGRLAGDLGGITI